MEENITINGIYLVCSILITYIFGVLSKKYNWIESKYIPIQNLLIGLLTGLIAYAVGLNNNIVGSIVSCLIGSVSAGGIYDTVQTRFEKREED